MTTMNKLRYPLLALVPALFFSQCAGQAWEADAEAFERELAQDGVRLIDVRTASEFASGHLEGALNLDWTNGQFEGGMSSLDKDAPVLLYCASGRRSAAARDALVKAGFKDVKHLAGGIGAWTRAGKAVVR